MKEFLEPLQKDPLFAEEGDGASGEGSGNALMSFGSEALARAISRTGRIRDRGEDPRTLRGDEGSDEQRCSFRTGRGYH